MSLSSPDRGDGTAVSGSDETVTWRRLLNEATARLGKVDEHPGGGPNPDARRIVEEASGVCAVDLALVLDEPVTEGAMARFDAMLARRATGEPLQYVLGHWGFRNLDLMVDHRVLIPRPETETVVEFALRELDRLGGRALPATVVDLGTGSGAIALAVATERVRSRVWATDASDAAIEVATANLAGVGRAAARVSLVHGDWYEALPNALLGRVQVVVSNPPYVAQGAELPREVADWEPASALLAGDDGLDDVRRIIAGAAEWLEADGVVVCEISPEQAGTVTELASGRFTEVIVEPDLTGRPRVLIARKALRLR